MRAIELGIVCAGHVTAEPTGPHHGELSKTGLRSGRNRPGVGVISHQILDECEAGINSFQEVIAAVQPAEDNFNSQRYQRTDARARMSHSVSSTLFSAGPGRYQMPTTLPMTIAEPIAIA